jgi:hypothetical protein
MAVNPADPANLIGVWQQDRWSDGSAHGLVAGFSSDGGGTWGETTLPFSACAGGLNYERASDPWVSIGPDGTAYAAALAVNESNGNSAVATVTSSDGGKSWHHLRVLIADEAPQFANDKETVTADPDRAGVAYVVWDRLESPTSNPDAHLPTVAVRGPAMFAETTDGGKTWSSPQVIVNTPAHQQTIGNQIVVDRRTDTLYDVFDLLTTPLKVSSFKVAYVKSTDGGASWTRPQVIADLRTAHVHDPNTGQQIRAGDIIPKTTIDPTNGQLYVVWQDSRFTGGQYDEIALSTSTDAGATWSAPIQVNTNTPADRPGFTPAVQVSSSGTVGVSFYDLRSLTGETTTLPTDYWLVTSTDYGASFGDEVHLAGPFDMLTAPHAGSALFIGDYQGLDTSGSTFDPFFIQTNSGDSANPTDVFATTATP